MEMCCQGLQPEFKYYPQSLIGVLEGRLYLIIPSDVLGDMLAQSKKP